VVTTTTLAPTTTTKTVYVAPTCPSASTVTTTAAASTVTVTKGSSSTVTVTVTKGSSSTSSGSPSSTCVVSDAKATAIVNNFIELLEFTSFPGNATEGIPKGRGYKQDVSDATLSPLFSDTSDSINLMAGFPIGSVTFPTKQYFDIGQGQNQPEVSVTTLNIFHDCSSITWRYSLLPNPYAFPVTGINYMIIGDDGLILKNYAEFDNAAWLESFGQKCATSPITVSSGPPALKRSVRH